MLEARYKNFIDVDGCVGFVVTICVNRLRKSRNYEFIYALPIGTPFTHSYRHTSRGGYRNFLRGGGTVNKRYKKVGVDPKRGWVREGDMPPPARSAEAFDTIKVVKH